MPLFRQIALLGGVVFFIALLLPWLTASLGMFGSVSGNGWNGIGVMAGLLVIVLVAWEVLRLVGQAEQITFSHNLITAGLAGLTALFGLVQFIRVLSNLGGGVGIGFGAIIGFIVILALGYAAFLAFQAAGGAAAVKEAQAGADDDERPAGSNAG